MPYAVRACGSCFFSFTYLFQFHNVNHIPHKANTIRDGDKPVALRCSTNCGSPCTDALTDGDRDGLTLDNAEPEVGQQLQAKENHKRRNSPWQKELAFCLGAVFLATKKIEIGIDNHVVP